MTLLLELEEQLRDTTAAIAQHEKAMAHSKSPSLAVGLRSLQKRLERLEAEFTIVMTRANEAQTKPGLAGPQQEKTMTTETITIAIYGQQCSGKAGMVCCDPERIYGEEWRDSADLDVFEGTADELRETAEEFRRAANSIGGGNGAFMRKQASVIEEAIR